VIAGGIAIGNVVGSNVANLDVLRGVTALRWLAATWSPAGRGRTRETAVRFAAVGERLGR
jgi:hypothetical protein